MEDEVEVFLPGDRIQATGPVRGREQVHLRAHCIRCARGTPGGNPQQAEGFSADWRRGLVWGGLACGQQLKARSTVENLENARRCRRDGVKDCLETILRGRQEK